MVELDKISRVYLIGIGGIGMSALARYFKKMGMQVAGYDSTPTPLTDELLREGIDIHFTDEVKNIPREFSEDIQSSLIVYTPAVANSHSELQFFIAKGYQVVKRSQALGAIANGRFTVAIAGTHGKTTTSTMLAHLLCQTPMGCDAFLGGISKNYANNLLLSDRGKNILVVEADEYDRSFLNLYPNLAIITSIDADHLDIFGTHEEVKNAFRQFVDNIKPNGVIIVKKGLEWVASSRSDVKVFTYSTNSDASFSAQNIEFQRGYNSFSIETPNDLIEGITLGVMGRYNIENALAASAAAIILGASADDIIGGLESFKGVSRRFDLRFSGKKSTYIDDYAHHPEELRAAILSAKEMFPGRRITGIFQPHLYSRTRDFANEFAESLSNLDELILTDIYPAREEPIPGVTPEIILANVTCDKRAYCSYEDITNLVKNSSIDVLLTMGAGNIDKLATTIVEILKGKEK
jgi:UDP-N-acetylmuramate--alanine ligase